MIDVLSTVAIVLAFAVVIASWIYVRRTVEACDALVRGYRRQIAAMKSACRVLPPAEPCRLNTDDCAETDHSGTDGPSSTVRNSQVREKTP